MANKFTAQDLTTLTPEQSAVTVINSNFDLLEEALDNTLSRDGTTPNSMDADLDMDSNSIINLPEATTATEPVRLNEFEDLEDRVDDVETSIGNIDAQLALANAAVADAESLLAEAIALDDYYIAVWAPHLMEAAEVLLDHLFTDSVVFPANLAGSRAECRDTATSSKNISIQKNDVEFATITFGIGADTGTFSASSETTFDAGDVLSFVAPGSADSTLGNITITLTGNLA